jgi:hypothetical protein
VVAAIDQSGRYIGGSALVTLRRGDDGVEVYLTREARDEPGPRCPIAGDNQL